MAQQTAVNWLIQQVNSEQYQIAFGQTYISIDLIEQAKQMEKEQMLEIWMQFFQDSYHTKPEFIRLFDKYYNETYGSNNQI